MTTWVRREYTKSDIDRAGEHLIPWWKREVAAPLDLGQAYMIIENWRTSHARPLLAFRIGLERRAKRIDTKALISQRLKRFSSLMNKLVREPNMKLSQMQDLGGCRAVLTAVSDVEKLYDMYRGDPGLFGEGAIKCYDYIQSPKADGYRGIHVIGRFEARAKNTEAWNGQRIEIQLRSQIQHAFATAVETVTTFTREPLKFGAGPEKWRRFFSLTGSAFAIKEQTPLVIGTPTGREEILVELRDLAKSLNVNRRLKGWTSAMKKIRSRNLTGAIWLLLVLDISGNTISVTGYKDSKKAGQDLAKLEKTSDLSRLDVVLVWVGSIKYLKKAYPNYFADTRAFLTELNSALII